MNVRNEPQDQSDRPRPPASGNEPGKPAGLEHTDHASPVRSGAKVVIVGGGPGGYEAAVVAARMGADVTLVEDRGLGGSAVLTDVVPSKTLIATAEQAQEVKDGTRLGVLSAEAHVDLRRVNDRVRSLSQTQSADIREGLVDQGVRIVEGRGSLEPAIRVDGQRSVRVSGDHGEEVLDTDIVLLATGAHPRELPSARPDGKRILTWKQLYELDDLPQHLIVVGSGVTGAEFASAYLALGAQVTLVSSRDRILPGEDPDAAEIIEKVFRARGMNVENRTRAEAVTTDGQQVTVTLSGGRQIIGSHCLVAVGAIPNTRGLGLEAAGVEKSDSGHIRVDRVSRTTAYRVYAAGDCTGVLPLASVAAEQGRIAMWHALGDSLEPLDPDAVSRAVFTSPEVASVGVSEVAAQEAGLRTRTASLPLARNPRAKMQGISEGFVKIIASRSGLVLGGTVVGRQASDLIFPLALAVQERMTVDELARASTIYPSVSGTITEVARMLH